MTDRSLRHYIGVSLSAAVLVLVLGLALVVIVIPKLAGGIPLTVLTSSMEPHLPPGTLLVVTPVKTDDIRIGDVVTYQIASGRPDVITHRVVSIISSADGSRRFVLKGDNNAERDPVDVISDQVRGRLLYSLPLLGHVNNAVNGQNKSWILPVLAVLLFAYAGYSIVSGIVVSRRKKRKASLGPSTGSIPVDVLMKEQSRRRSGH